jgi:Cytochrome c oxidase assembly protein CtaG/Cox11
MKPPPYILAVVLLLLPPGLKSHGAEALPDLREPSFGVKILFRLSLSNAPDLSVVLSRSEVVVQPGDLFEVSLNIKNQSKQPVNARIDHVIEPLEVVNYLDLVECGFVVPVTLHPEVNQQYSVRYLLRQGIPDGVHQLSVTYDFKLRRVLGAKQELHFLPVHPATVELTLTTGEEPESLPVSPPRCHAYKCEELPFRGST